MAGPWEEYQSDSKPWEEYQQPSQQPSRELPQKGFLGTVSEALSKPGAAVRAPFFGKSPVEGFQKPEEIPTFKSSFEKSYWNDVGKQSGQMGGIGSQIHPYMMVPGGMAVSAAGMGADIATDPMTYVFGGAAKLLSKTPVGTAIGRFLSKERTLPDITKPIKEYKQLGQELKALGKNYDDLPLGEIPRKLEEESIIKQSELAAHELSFKNAMKTAADENAIAAKPKIAKFGEELTKSYDSKIDQVDDIFTKSDEPINVNKFDIAKDWLEPSVSKLSGNVKEQNRLIRTIRNLGYDVMQGASMDEAGNAVWNITPRGRDVAEIPLTFRDLISHKNEIIALKGSASSAARHSFVDFLSDETKFPFNVSQIYKEMQSEYGPLASAKWQADKIFKPFDPANVNTKQASAFLERMATGSLEAGQQRMVKLIEAGSDFSPGVGDISSAMKKVGLAGKEKSLTLSRQIEDTMSDMKSAKDYLAKRQKMAKDATWLIGKLGLGGTGLAVAEKLIRK